MSRHALLVLAGPLIVACAEQAPPPAAPLELPAYSDGPAHANGGNFGTPLNSREEVMPAGVVNTSRAVGNAIFHLNADGTELRYKLIVANIENPFMAHIHRAPAGTNGGVVVWLFPSTTPNVRNPVGAGRVSGVIAEGVITSRDLTGTLAGQPLSALLDLIVTGNAYVNVHTDPDGVLPVNTGPGDYPGGEIRGQIEARGNN